MCKAIVFFFYVINSKQLQVINALCKLMIEAVDKTVERFCRTYGMTMTAGFNVFKYNASEIEALASFWCRKMRYFYDIYSKGGSGYVFSEEDVGGFVEPDEIHALMQAGPRLVFSKRVAEIRAVRPHVPK